MRFGPYSIRHDNMVVAYVRLWSGTARPRSESDGRIITVGVQRQGGVAWLARWSQADTTLPENTSQLLTGQSQLNYPLQEDDVIVAEEAEFGAPAEALRGLVAEVQLSRVGEVAQEAQGGRSGLQGPREVLRPLFSMPAAQPALEPLVRALNESGLPDLSLPIYFA